MMKKVLIFLCLVSTWMNWSQTNPIQDIKMSPNGYFDAVMDRFGNKYQLKDLQITDQIFTKSAALSCDSGIFELYFEPGCGMDNTADAANNARRAVVCQVLKDVSDFINTPLKNAGNTTKVKIWVRNPANLSTPMPADALGSASSFYTMPYSTVSNFGGIIDGEVYKTIQGGKDSFTNVASPLVNSNGTTSSGNYYHGMMVFNFTNFTWNTNLTLNATSSQYDLYSVVLHEITHALGFNSLLNKDGNSVFGLGFKYYTRYDRFLKNNASSQFLLTNTGACSTMYDYSFNASMPATVLQPNISSCVTNQTTCSSALKFVGTNTIPIYTPNCFEQGSSYSHFEDMCIPAPNTGNDAYFAMSNAQGTGITKRFLKPEERAALIDIGYSLNTTYGNNTTATGSFNNYGGSVITGLDVAGINDGISNTGTFSFIGNVGTSIAISGILENDYNATSFECIKDVFDNTANISISGATINFTSSVAGLHLLRYIPINSIGKKGNITYIYLYVNESDSCGVSTSCNLVINGDFEQYDRLPTSAFQLNGIVCKWNTVCSSDSSEYFNSDNNVTMPYNLGVPCNFSGYEFDKISNNKGYIGGGGLIGWNQSLFENIRTKLSSPLLPNTTYLLTFDVSLSESYNNLPINFQAYLSRDLISTPNFSFIPISNNNMLFTDNNFSDNTSGWRTISRIFTTGTTAGEEYLYLGALSSLSMPNVGSIMVSQNPVPCAYVSTSNNNVTYYYLDNVSLIPLNGANFDLPAQVCNTVTLPNLTNYLTATPTNGVFSGPGVVNTGGTYSFNATTAGVGTHTISYTYNNSSGCSVTISDTVTVVNTNIIVPTFNPIAPVCPGTTPVLPTISTNGITGTWALTSSTATSLVYTFTPTAGQCTSPTLTTRTVTILPASDPSCGGQNPCQNAYTLSVPESNTSITYRALNTIESNTNYQVATGKQVTMKCENSISFKPGTYLNNGSTVWAKIQPCSDPSKIVINDVNTSKSDSNKNDSSEIAESNKISLFPNPSDFMITIQTGVSKQLAINIYTLDGKLIYQNSVNQSSLDIDVSSFVQGMYLVEIKVDENLIKKVKFVKN